jgi:ATP-dependent Lon protease
LAHALGTHLGLPVTIYGCAGVADASFGGTNRQWNSGRASVPLQAIRRAMVANPLIVLDEIEKAGTRSDNGRLVDSLIPYLEQETARQIFDPYLECAVDLSAVSYAATANSLSGIPQPLLDRFRVLEIPVPGREHLPAIVRTMTQDVRAERGGDPAWIPDLDEEEIQLIAEQWDGGSMRRLRRMIEVVLSGREILAARH